MADATPHLAPASSPQAVSAGLRSVPIVDCSASAPGVPLPSAVWLEPTCPTCGDRLFAFPKPNAERLSHICWNGHKWRDDG